jgi:tetratricopeptide (TPR) repeat protein
MKPNRGKVRYLWIILVSCLFILSNGCASKEDKKDDHWLRARQYIEKKEFKKAVIELENVIQLDPGDDTAHYELGETYLKLKLGRESFQSFSRVVLINPDNLKAQLKIGQFFLLGKKTEEAREKAASIDPNHFNTHLSLARLLHLISDLNKSEKAYLEAVNSAPEEDVVPLKNLGGYYARRKLYDKALEAMEKAAAIKSGFAPAANNLAWNLAEKGGNIDEALGFAQIAKEQMPKSGAVMDTLGWIYYLKGSYLNAISELQDSVEVSPQNPVVNYHLGLAYYKNNRPDAAMEFLEKALEIDQNFKGAEGARSLLKGIKAQGPKRRTTGK